MRERVLTDVVFLFHLGCALFTVFEPECCRTVTRAVRIHPYSRGRRGTLTERIDHAEHGHGAGILGSIDPRLAVWDLHLARPRRHGGSVLKALLTRCIPLRLFSSPHQLTPHSQGSTRSSSCTSTFSLSSSSSLSARSPSSRPSSASRSSPRTSISRRRQVRRRALRFLP
jgi:hypothetical protein